MLPRQLSEGVVSLNQGQLRRAVVFEVVLDQRGRAVRTEVRRARVRSVKKLSYARVQRYYDEPAGSGFGAADFAHSLDLLREVGRLRLADARRRHVVDYNRREVGVRLGREQRLGFSVVTRDRLEVERYNEQISLLCNVEGALMLERSRGKEWVQAVFRVHPSPPPERLRHFADQVRAVVRAHGLDPEHWRWRRRGRAGHRGETLADYIDRLPRRGRWAGVTRAVERQALLTNTRSLFETGPGGHFGVGAPVYARLTAPMREIVGVFTHKELLEALSGPRGMVADAADEALREQIIEAGNRSRTVQARITKEANALVLDALFRAELELPADRRPRRNGVVLGMKPTVIYVELVDPPLEVKLYPRDLEAAHGRPLRVDRRGVTLGRGSRRGAPLLRVGDRVGLRVREWHEKRRRWLFDVQMHG
jgi:ribonuclease R